MAQAKLENDMARQIDGHVDEIVGAMHARLLANHLGETIQRAAGGH